MKFVLYSMKNLIYGAIQPVVQPVIVIRLMNTTLPQGNTHMFVCAAEGDPPPVLVFRFNGERISNSSKHTLDINSNNATLTVFNVQGSDEGSYTCSASNQYGSVSTAAELTVEGGLHGYDFAAVAFIYRCVCVCVSVCVCARVCVYVCVSVVTGDCVCPQSHWHDFALDFGQSFPYSSVPPVLTVFPSAERDVVKGENLVVTCRASGNPTPLIQWFKDYQPLNTGNQSSISISQNSNGNQLTVMEFKNENQGVYSCVAVNDLGNDSRLFQVKAVGTFELARQHSLYLQTHPLFAL